MALSFGLRRTAFVSAPEVAQVACAITDKLTDADCPISKEDRELLADTRKYAEPAWGTVGVNKNPEGASVITTPKPSEPYVRGKAPGESYAGANETRSDEETAGELSAPDGEATEAGNGVDTDGVPRQRTKLRATQLADAGLNKAWAGALSRVPNVTPCPSISWEERNLY